MAHDIVRETATPADQLRRLLDRGEQLLPLVKNSPQAARELLEVLDACAALFQNLRETGVDLRSETGRWEALQRSVDNRIKWMVAAIDDWEAARRRVQATEDRPWWYLDGTLAASRRRTLRRVALGAAGAALLVVAAILLVRHFFPVDPAVAAATSATLRADDFVSKGDWAGARSEYEQAASFTPNDAVVWVWLGVLNQELNDTQASEQAFARAQTLFNDPVRYHVERAFAYVQMGKSTPAETEARAALDLDENSAYAWYVLGGALEQQGKTSDAIAAYSQASDLSQNSDPSLTALARVRMSMLLQGAPFRETPAP